MKKTLLTLLLFSSICCALAQNDTHPFIEVTGTADMEVVPDEIYIAITIMERNNGNHSTAKEQEEALKNALKAIGLSSSFMNSRVCRVNEPLTEILLFSMILSFKIYCKITILKTKI